MSVGASIPAALEAIDRISATSTSCQVLVCMDMLLHIIRQLNSWCHSYSTTLCHQHAFDYVESVSSKDIWYPDITVANSLTHFWAFWLICAIYIRRLGFNLGWPRHFADELLGQEQVIRARSYSIMNSVPYLTQDHLKLYGATSLSLPVKVAYEYLQQAGDPNSIALCDSTIRHIDHRGHFYLNTFLKSDMTVLQLLPRISQCKSQEQQNFKDNTSAKLWPSGSPSLAGI